MDKGGGLKIYQVRDDIAFILYDKFFDYFNCIKKDTVCWLFNIKDFIYKKIRRLHIWTKNEYIIFTDIINKPNIKKIIYLRLANLEKDNANKKKNFSAYQLGISWQKV